MATAGIEITAEIAELRELQEALGRILTPAVKAKILKAALDKAIVPAFERLKSVTPVGPTGNLKRAVTKKVKSYSKDGNAVALIGFRRAAVADSESAAGGTVRTGPDRARHQYWLEDGTDDRVINTPVPPKTLNRRGFNRGAFQRGAYTMTRNGKQISVRAHTIGGHAVAAHTVQQTQAYYYASSFNRLGPFKIEKQPDGKFTTNPGSPRAFFKRSKEPITIRGIRPGGVSGRPPLTTAYNESQSQIAEILQRELRISLEQAISTLTRSRGTIG